MSKGPAVATLEAPIEATSGREMEPDEPWWARDGATLVEPVPVERPEMAAEARALENLLVSHFDGHDLTVPPLHRVAERVLARLHDPNCNLDKVAGDIAEDPVMAGTVLRITNSPAYRGVTTITALPAAVKRLGTKAIRTLMMHQMLRTAMFEVKGSRKELAGLVWERALASACIMRRLSAFTGLDAEEAFLIGLLHDIGSVVVLRTAQSASAYTHYEVDVDTFEYLCYECHQEFGELLADAWKLPSQLRDLIANHHAYPADDDPLHTERLQMQLTDMINALLGYAPPAPYNLRESRMVRSLGLAERPDFVSFLVDLPAQVEETISAL